MLVNRPHPVKETYELSAKLLRQKYMVSTEYNEERCSGNFGRRSHKRSDTCPSAMNLIVGIERETH